MKRTIAILALLFATASSVAATSAIRVTRHDGNGTGMALQTWTGGDEFANLRLCKEAVKKATQSTPRVISTCKVNYEDLYVAPPPPVVCPAASAPTTETIACPSGTTGTQTRTTTYVMGPPDACVQTATVGPLTGTCTPVPPPPPPPTGTGPTYYFSDCQVGAAAGCVPGSNANPGTDPALPKQNLAGFNVNALPAGSTLLFKRGGAWPAGTLTLNNPNSTAASPLVLDAYGAGDRPWLVAPTCANGLNLGGTWGNTTNDGGYVIRNLKIAPAVMCTGTQDHFGVWFVQNVRDVVMENNEITGFRIGLNSSEGTPYGINGITLRNNLIHRNRAMGLLGHYDNLLLEGNTIEANNFGGSSFDHGTYIGGGHNVTLRNNRYIRNSSVNGTCTGGNMTFHGQIEGLTIEGNEIVQDAATPTCYGVSITRGYTSAEWFRNAIVRNNKIVNVGSGIAAQSAPGIVVENNVLWNTGMFIGSGSAAGTGGDAGDVGDTGAVVRGNTICRTSAGSVTVNSPGGLVESNLVRTGADASTGVCAR